MNTHAVLTNADAFHAAHPHWPHAEPAAGTVDSTAWAARHGAPPDGCGTWGFKRTDKPGGVTWVTAQYAAAAARVAADGGRWTLLPIAPPAPAGCR